MHSPSVSDKAWPYTTISLSLSQEVESRVRVSVVYPRWKGKSLGSDIDTKFVILIIYGKAVSIHCS